MRMAVAVGRRAVGCPTGMTDAHNTTDGIAAIDLLRQNFESSLSFCYLQARLTLNADAGRVIAPVLQLGKTLQKDRGRLTVTRVTNDSTHIRNLQKCYCF